MQKIIKNLNLHFPECSSLNFAVEQLEKIVLATDFEQIVNINLIKSEILDEQEYNIVKTSENIINIEYTFIDGAVYALLDLVGMIKTQKSLSSIKDGKVSPYIKNRGIKFNIPLDARSPSYSDESDSAQKNIENMWDMSFWKTFIDELALNKYNGISIWSLAPFPSMVHVEDYPLISLNDVKRTTRKIVSKTEGDFMTNPDVLDSMVTLKKMTIQEKILFWQEVMQYAHDRCIKFYLFTWNLFSFGMEGNPYGVDNDLDNPATVDYFTKAVESMVKTYPLLSGIGITTGEKMTRTPEKDIPWIRNTYAKGVELALADTPDRKFKFIHRLQYANIQKILDTYSDFNGDFDVSLKYSQAHMYSNIKPKFTQSTMDVLPEHINYWLTLRNDDYYMFRWGDPSFARDYLTSIPKDNDVLEGFFMGPDGYTWGREYISKDKDVYGTLVFEKMRYSFTIWGQLAFNHNLDNDYFTSLLAYEFGGDVAENLFNAWSLSSGLFGEFIQTHWWNFDFQWYPEACCRYLEPKRAMWFCDINEFMQCPSQPMTDRISVSDYCASIVQGNTLEGVSPLCTAKKLQSDALKSREILQIIKEQNISKELNRVLIDIDALSHIGLYYGLKLEAAIELTLARALKDTSKQQHAVELLEECSCIWCDYCDIVDSNYIPQHLTRFKEVIDVKRFIEQTQFDIMFAKEDIE